MIRFTYTVCAAMFVLVCANLIPALSQDMGGEKKEGDMHEEWGKLHAPGAEHKWLAEQVGEWNVEGKMWMDPTKDPMPFKATSKITMSFDRFIHEEFKGENEQSMHGFGIFGYDNSNKEFQGLWTSNMGTSMHIMSGQLDEKTNKMSMSGEWTEKGMGGMKVKSRVITTRKSKDEAVVEVFDTYGDSPEMKIVEMTYKRKK
ncbi:hypothetical protein ANRL4_00729 [Anaerolineae bacterium]|nr:hypothetical protein ANRL4_00729 [Anaerolineae bacterium]